MDCSGWLAVRRCLLAPRSLLPCPSLDSPSSSSSSPSCNTPRLLSILVEWLIECDGDGGMMAEYDGGSPRSVAGAVALRLAFSLPNKGRRGGLLRWGEADAAAALAVGNDLIRSPPGIIGDCKWDCEGESPRAGA